MRRLLAIILAALMMCTLSATAVFADEIEDIYPEEGVVVQEEYVPREPLTLYSDEIGDYHLYEDGAVKAYVRLNQDAVTVVMEGSAVAIYDNDGNYIVLDESFNLSEHPWIEEITDEYVRQNSEYDENGNLIVMPAIGISYYAPPRFGSEEEIDMGIVEAPDEVSNGELNYADREEDGYSIPQEGSDGSAGTASNPNTGVAFAVTPAILAAFALIFKKR